MVTNLEEKSELPSLKKEKKLLLIMVEKK